MSLYPYRPLETDSLRTRSLKGRGRPAPTARGIGDVVELLE